MHEAGGIDPYAQQSKAEQIGDGKAVQQMMVQGVVGSGAQTDSSVEIGGLKVIPPGAAKKKPGRNEPCWCGSGKKYKKCHYPNVA